MDFSKFEKVIIGLLIGVVIIFTMLRQFQKPKVELEAALGVASSSISENSNELEEIPEDIYVHIAGAVVNPGFLKMESGSRVIDAVEAAGGMTEEADINAINLALKLEDEDRVYIPKISENGESSSSKTGGKININTASESELLEVPGIGEKTARKIIDYREKNTFKNIEDIMNVPGIGEGKFSQMKDYISVK